MKFPKTVRFHKAQVKVYGMSPRVRRYRVAGYIAGKRSMSRHATYSDAIEAAEKLVRKIARGDQSAGLNSQQASDALAALQRLQTLHEDTGLRVSLLSAVSQFAEACTKLGKVPLPEAVDGFLRTVAPVKRIDIAAAVEEFIAARKTKTVAKEGKRPQLSPEYHAQTAGWLREFAKANKGHEVCELTKEHLSRYMSAFGELAPKTRNARRGVVTMFINWTVERDYLPANHRLFETTEMKQEPDDPEEIACYRPEELASLLANADKDFLPVVALAGLAGIRFKEICRLTWENVFRVPDHIEIAAMKSKTRSRRLVQVSVALNAWLEPFRKRKGPVWSLSYDQIHWHLNRLLSRLEIQPKNNGLRHSFISAHYALHADEGLTAQQAGNTPDMIHKHYKGLFTKADGEKWFAVMPAQPANVVPMTTCIQGDLRHL